jgi:hypothetical protein
MSAFRSLFLLVCCSLMGCHSKFRRAAPDLDLVRLQVVTTGEVSADLGGIPAWTDSDLANAAILAANLVQHARAVDQADRIAHAVDVQDVNTELYRGIEETLAGGPPFGLTDQEDSPLMQLELLEYGLHVPYIGAAGRFTYTVRARIYDTSGQRVYRARLQCDTGIGDTRATSQILGISNNVKQLKSMSDAQINESFAAVARYCGQKFVVKMRRHAG